MELWLIALIAVVFTAYGYWWGLNNQLKRTTEAVIDTLIEQGYLKTQGSGKDLEILKHTEWNKE